MFGSVPWKGEVLNAYEDHEDSNGGVVACGGVLALCGVRITAELSGLRGRFDCAHALLSNV
jgi:hypothetical protein